MIIIKYLNEEKIEKNIFDIMKKKMEQLVKGKSIDVSKVSTSAPKPLDNGSKLVYVNYGGPMTKFNVQTPWME